MFGGFFLRGSRSEFGDASLCSDQSPQPRPNLHLAKGINTPEHEHEVSIAMSVQRPGVKAGPQGDLDTLAKTKDQPVH